MDYRKLGKSGLKISELSLGSWLTFGRQFGEKQAREMMALAYDHGINFFDNAEAYAHGEAEFIMGNVLKKLNYSRDSYCVSSKVFWGGDKPTQKGLSRKHIFDACHAALKRLEVEYLDLFFCHRPDISTPIEETVWAMHHLIQQGKVLYWGTSEWSSQQITAAIEIAQKHYLIPPTMDQSQYNMFHREKLELEYLPLFRDYHYGITTWSPLASGILTGKYNDKIPSDSRANLSGQEWLKERILNKTGQDQLDKVKKLELLADVLETQMPQLAIAWCLQNAHVNSIILGTSKIEQLQQNLLALEVKEKLTEPMMIEIETILQNKPKEEPVY